MSASCPVSVIISCYNSAAILPAAVESVLAQRLIGVEVLIVDDGSTDSSAAVAASLAKRHPSVRVVRHEENSGPAAARNRGLRLASGVFVCFLDADDTYAPHFFRTLLPMFQAQPDLAAISTGIELVGCQRDVHPYQLQVITNSLPSNLIVRRSVASFLQGFPEDAAFRGKAAGEDAAFRQALLQFFKIERSPEPLLRYLVKPGSHFDQYLDRSEVRDGRLQVVRHTEEERNGSLKRAVNRYLADIEARIAALQSVKTETA